MIIIQLLINALIAGSLYTLVAIGFSLVYASSRFIHFAHGAVVASGSFIFFTCLVLWQQSYSVAMAGALFGSGFLGASLYYGIYRPLQRRQSSTTILLIASLGLMILLENLLLLIFGADLKTISAPALHGIINLAGAAITPLQIIIIAAAFGMFLAIWLIMKYTRWGQAVRAVADNAELAAILGIPVVAIQRSCFIIAAMLAGAAGILAALEQNVEPFMGVGLIIKGFTGTIVGGALSLPGSVLGSFLLGIVENFGIWYLPSGYKDAIAFALLLVFLLVRPQGILGIKRGVRE